MNYWVVRGKPSENPFDDMLVPNTSQVWRTARPPKSWSKGDRLFFWASSPVKCIIGLGELKNTTMGMNEFGDSTFKVEYLTPVIPNPLSINKLRASSAINDASFLKVGPTQTVLPLTQKQGTALYRIVISDNPKFHIWKDIGLINPQPPVVSLEKDFNEKVLQARSLSSEERRKRISASQKIPQKIETTTTTFLRSPYVVAEVLLRADGVCERCKRPAPFKRASDGTPYLEVHHKKRLADGGEDSVRNALALCPNCHRYTHFA